MERGPFIWYLLMLSAISPIVLPILFMVHIGKYDRDVLICHLLVELRPPLSLEPINFLSRCLKLGIASLLQLIRLCQ